MRTNTEAWFKDIVGNTLEVGNCVITCHNGRIVVARIENIGDTNVVVQPLEADAKKRRGIPPQKPLRRLPYNVFAINPKEIFWAELKDSL
jgi:hypothetical protein